MLKPLEGVKVVDFTLAGAGPSGTGCLTQFGAENIWVEPIGGQAYPRLLNQLDFYCSGKKSITLNLKDPNGIEVMYKLIKEADVFFHNMRQKAVDKLGLSWKKLNELNPRLIYCSLTGWGEYGPKTDAPGYDTVCFWSRGGMLQDIAEKGSLVVPPIAVADAATGLNAALGVCAALYQRNMTGKGMRVYTSILAEAVYLNHDALIEVQHGETYPKTRKAPRRAFLNTYKCSDDKWFTLLTNNFNKDFPAIMKIIGREDLIDDPRWKCLDDTMYDKAPELVTILDEGFGKLLLDDAVAALEANDIACEKVQSTVDVLTDPQVRANNYMFDWVNPKDGKKYTMPTFPIKFGNHELNEFTNAPEAGEHTAEILKSVGYSDEKIQEMIDKKIAGV